EIGQEFTERVGVLDHRRLDRLEAVALIDPADRFERAARGRDLEWGAIVEAARPTRLQLVLFFVSHGLEAPRGRNRAQTRRNGKSCVTRPAVLHQQGAADGWRR